MTIDKSRTVTATLTRADIECAVRDYAGKMIRGAKEAGGAVDFDIFWGDASEDSDLRGATVTFTLPATTPAKAGKA